MLEIGNKVIANMIPIHFFISFSDIHSASMAMPVFVCNRRCEIRSSCMNDSTQSSSDGSIPARKCCENRIFGLGMANMSPKRGSCKSKVGSMCQTLSSICNGEMPEFAVLRFLALNLRQKMDKILMHRPC
jgi:hypothetical protein